MSAPATRALFRQFTSFLGVGALGFLVDATLFVLLTDICCGWPTFTARALSATCSITTTWALNRQLTFADRRSDGKVGEYLRYVLGQVAGLCVNLGVFALCVLSIPQLQRHRIVALTIGAATAVLFNFALARTLAFRGVATPRSDAPL